MPTHAGFYTSSNGTIVNGDNLNFGTLQGALPEMDVAGKIPIATGAAFPAVQIKCNTLTAGPGVTITNGPGTITVGLTGGGAAIEKLGVQASTPPGTNPVTPNGANQININGAAVAAAGIPVRSDSIAANTIQIEVQRASASALTNATAQGLASFNSAQFTVDANGWVSAIPGAGSIDITPNTGVHVTNSTFSLLGTSVAAAGIPLRSNGTAPNSIQLEVQRASQQAASAAANAGIASFSSAQFAVDANGFVTNLNGLPSSNFPVQAATAPGTNPVLPSAGGAVTINGTIVAAHAIPLRSDSLAANTINIEAQFANAAVGSVAANAGMASFNSADFTVDANGFVSSISGTAPWLDAAAPTALVNHTGYFATSAGAFTLPVGIANGDQVELVSIVAGGAAVTAQGGNFIEIGNVVSSANGTATSTQKGDSLRLTFRLADLTWYATPGVEGNWVLA